MKIVIRAGGVGTRLWPYSREAQPKQLRALISKKSLLAEAIERVIGLVKKPDLYITTSKICAPAVRQEAKRYRISNLIVEPERKDTAAAIGLELMYLTKRNPQVIIASLGSDHLVKKPEELKRILKIAEKTVRQYPQYIVAIGARADFPDIGYGYIQLGNKLTTINSESVYKLKKFTEKPKLELARRYIEAGNYLWNGNMFVWRADTILALFQKFLPKMYQSLKQIQAAIGTKEEQSVLNKIYPQLDKTNIDQAIIEKAPKVAAIKLEAGWSDIGDWERLKDKLTELPQDNLVRANHVGLATENCLIYGPQDKLIATIGLKNQVIVLTDDALLVADKSASQMVKNLVEELKKKKKTKYL